MPFSDPANEQWVRWFLTTVNPLTVLDIGAGSGKYGRIIEEELPHCRTTAVEVWAPYVYEYKLHDIYDTVHICDSRIYPSFAADLVVFGDVLEHMTKAESVALWNKARREAKAALIAIPITHMPQGHEHGNPFEEHVKDDWTHEEVMNTFKDITGFQTFGATATYVGEFK